MKNKTPLLGVFYITLSSLGYASYGVWSRLMGESFDGFSQAAIRCFFVLVTLVIFGKITGAFTPIRRGDLKWFLAISIPGGLNQQPFYYAFQHLTLGTASLLFYASFTFGTYILGKAFFKEKIGLAKTTAFILGMIGLVVIFKFELSSNQLIPALSAIFAGLLGSVGVVFTKKLSKNYSEIQLLCSYCIVTIISSSLVGFFAGMTVPALAFSVPWFGLIGYALCYIIANYSAVVGYRAIKDPSVGGILGLSEIIFGVVFGVFIFNEALTASFFVGSLILLMAMLIPLVAVRTDTKLR